MSKQNTTTHQHKQQLRLMTYIKQKIHEQRNTSQGRQRENNGDTIQTNKQTNKH
jgi:hypothetical protein